MTYFYAKTFAAPFDQTVTATCEALKTQGFGVITEIDVRQTMQSKIGEAFRPYVILGACNPRMAFEALQIEDRAGLMLPCNVIVQDRGAGQTEVAAIDPVASMQAIDNPALKAKAEQVGTMLRAALDEISI